MDTSYRLEGLSNRCAFYQEHGWSANIEDITKQFNLLCAMSWFNDHKLRVVDNRSGEILLERLPINTSI